jgi:nitroreductase
MDALTLLHGRNSSPKLTTPAPDGQALESMLQAAMRVPDHARLRPWRFLTIDGDARQRLGELFVEATNQRLLATNQPALTAEEAAKLAAKPLRAPLIMVVIASVVEHHKVPQIEQLLSAGCAAHAILLAAHALGFAGVWRTGSNAFDATVNQGLGLKDNESISGFIYLGSVDGNYKPLPKLDAKDFCQPWQP